jgi:outer membrane protein
MMMNRCIKTTLLAAAISLGWLGQAQASDSFVPVPEDMNIIGLSVGMVPDYEGSDDYTAGIAPAAFYKFEGSERWIQLLGPEVTLNLLNSPTWSFGPLVNYRFGRDDDVDSDFVSKMEEIDDTVEAGAFLRWRHIDPNNQRNRESVRVYAQADMGDEHEGWLAGVNATMFRQVSKAVDLMGGVGYTYASDDYMDTYFGVNADNVGTSGISFYEADGGSKDVRLTVGAIVHFSTAWHMGAGVQYRKLMGDASDSPITDKYGDDNQWIGGAALVYSWGKK